MNKGLEGQRIGPYAIGARIGVGGMGEVYRATDVNLHRDVAIKVLLPALANDPDRLARFGREARVLASLNHPHIAQIHGLEGADGVRALVMELVEGPTLADRLERGALAIDESLSIAKQIAEALTAAHDQGIIHRDLKPANIKVREDGTVKVLDFGLAKAFDPTGGSGVDPVDSPTISAHATKAGVILGTPAYMAPEQARGGLVDKRADLWAFGAVVYEMVTGRRAFWGENVSDTLAHVLMKEPDWNAVPATTPAPIRRLLRRCLEKDRKRRLDSAAAARLEIEDALAPADAQTLIAAATPSRRLAPFVLAALTGGAVVGSLVMWTVMRPAPRASAGPSRFAIVPPALPRFNLHGFARDLALSPDGRYLVYRAGGDNNVGSLLMVRAIDQLDAKPLPGISGALAPFFSFDGQWIGFFQNSELKKVKVTGGPAVPICPVRGKLLGASWGDDNTIVFATDDASSGLWRVSAAGGEPEVLTKPDAARRENRHAFPSALPGGRGVLFTIAALNPTDRPQVAVLDLKTGQHRTLIPDASHAEYVTPSIASTGSERAGYLVYAAVDSLRAVQFDPVTLEVLTDPVTVVERVRIGLTGVANYAVSQTGTLVYEPGGPGVELTPRSLVWVDRKGRETPTKAPVRPYAVARLSPDGTRVVVGILDEAKDLWIWDFLRETLTPFAVSPGSDIAPVWTHDSQRIVFASSRGGPTNLWVQAADSTTAVRLTTNESSQWSTSITPDDTRVVAFQQAPSSAQLFHIVQFPVPPSAGPPPAGTSRCASPLPVDPLVEAALIGVSPDISPDCRFMAYAASGQVWVRPWPDVNSRRWQVSKEGGRAPVWGGHDLFYLDGSNRLTSVTFQTSGSTFIPGVPAPLSETRYPNPTSPRGFDVSRDGQRLLVIKDSAGSDPSVTPAGFVVVLNWLDDLKARVPARK